MASFADIPTGTSIPVEVMSDANSAGDQMTYKISVDIRDSSGTVIVPAGASAQGRVIQRSRGGMWGGPGKVEIAMDTIITQDGKTLKVAAKRTRYGRDLRVATVILSPFLIGFFIKGGGGGISAGDKITFTTQ
jgi:hypothetical protein